MSTPLSLDILPSVDAIAVELYGEANPSTTRRIRHLIAAHGLPVKKVAGRWESRRSWLAEYYAEPDRRASGNGGER